DGEPPDSAVLGVGLAGVDRVGNDELAQFRLGDARRGAARQYAVRAISEDLRGAFLLERRRGVAQGAGRIDDVVDEDARARVDITDDVHHLRFAGALAALVDDRQRGIVEALGEPARADHAA